MMSSTDTFNVTGGISLKMVRVSVPQYTLRGDPVELLCEFDLQGDRLYSVSWYKDHDEFYRYVPRGNPPQHTYYIDGINVDHHKSDAQKVVIRNVPLRSSGMYRCEVSAEAPAFSSVHGESRMNVVALPQDGPEITGEERNYQIGDEINLNCTSAKSFPPARLRWYVNDELVGPDYEAVVQQHGLMTSTAGLRFQVGPEHFHKGRLQVRCVATISTSTATPTVPAPAPVLQHQRLSASGPPPALDYNREALFFVKGVSSTTRSSVTFLLMVTSFFLLVT
ncbi:uncharacterized protein LOC129002270 [Macrosteles quadrilineatus]|uniref:uncharacterized protein LOC129002270 n=1 Tax=Macrosteles quadrilineatus TaxID=74068 RepID=UPI0023E27B43|nr:uncharacterized protein LOC129002270 [Macrosteles quadrilineatus]